MFSHYEESDANLKLLNHETEDKNGGDRIVSSLMADDKNDLIKRQDDSLVTPMSEHQDEEYSNAGNVQASPVIGVTSVHIQKTTSVQASTSKRLNKRQTSKQKTTALNNAIKHVDESIDNREHESH